MDWTYEINMLMAAYLQLQKIMAVIILRINEEERFEHPAPGKEAAHMAYSERIKNFGRIRDCLRQFQVCGFKSRTELKKADPLWRQKGSAVLRIEAVDGFSEAGHRRLTRWSEYRRSRLCRRPPSRKYPHQAKAAGSFTTIVFAPRLRIFSV